MKYLSKSSYEAVLKSALRELPMADIPAERLIAARYPMDILGVIGEAGGRGLEIDREAVLDALGELIEDAGSYDFGRALFGEQLVEEILAWIVLNDRAKLNLAGTLIQGDASWVRRKFCEPKPAAGTANAN